MRTRTHAPVVLMLAASLLEGCASTPPLRRLRPTEGSPVETSVLLLLDLKAVDSSVKSCEVDFNSASGTRVGTLTVKTGQPAFLAGAGSGRYRLGAVRCEGKSWEADPSRTTFAVASDTVSFGGGYRLEVSGKELVIQPMSTRQTVPGLAKALSDLPANWRGSVVNGRAEGKKISESWLAQAKDPRWSVKWKAKGSAEPNLDSLMASLATCANDELKSNPLHLGELHLIATYDTGAGTKVQVAGRDHSSSEAFESCARKAAEGALMGDARGLVVEMRY
ncbi:MAG: hypothetical protein IT285_00120 [Bdellovibrionales bacterium]|nr:hypothetical protein [Bdellovibrionales bacterium]